MDKKKILFIIGSPKADSMNRALSNEVREYIGDRADIEYLDYSDVPLMNPDIEFPAPEPVQRVRDKISSVDGVWIFFPEYNHSYPAQLKSLLDWVSRPLVKGGPRTDSTSSGVKVTYSSVSGKGGAERAFVLLQELLDKIHMEADQSSLTALSEPGFADGKIILEADKELSLKKQADNFLDFIS